MSKKRFIALFTLVSLLAYAALSAGMLAYLSGKNADNRADRENYWEETAERVLRETDTPEEAIREFTIYAGDNLTADRPYLAAVYLPDGALQAKTEDRLLLLSAADDSAGTVRDWLDLSPYMTPEIRNRLQRFVFFRMNDSANVESLTLAKNGDETVPVTLTLKYGYGAAGLRLTLDLAPEYKDKAESSTGFAQTYVFSVCKTRRLTRTLHEAQTLLPGFGEQLRVKYGPAYYPGKIELNAPGYRVTTRVFHGEQGGQPLYFVILYAENAFLNTLKLGVWPMGLTALLFLFVYAAALILALRWRGQRERLAYSRYSFLSAAAHELKTPIAVIAGAGECLAENVAPEKTAEYAEVILHESERMKTLVENMLRQNRFLSAAGIQKARTDLSALVRREAEAYAPAARQKQITLSVKTEPDLWIDCDAEMIAVAVRNFLSNAVKYAPAGERITVTAAKEGNKAAVRVKNTGSRVSPEALPHIWEELYREDGVRADGAGSGLGLSICRRVFELHRFAYGCVSDDTGVEFRFSAPRRRKEKPAQKEKGRRSANLHPAEISAAATLAMIAAGLILFALFVFTQSNGFLFPCGIFAPAGMLGSLLTALLRFLAWRDKAKLRHNRLVWLAIAAFILPPVIYFILLMFMMTR